MIGPPKRRRARPRAGSSSSREFIAAVNSDSPEDTTEAPETQAAHRNSFAREATIAEFGWRHARALDQGDFVDRKPRLIRIGLVADRIVQRLALAQEVQNGSR